MYRPDAEFARSLVPGTRGVLEWYAQYEQPDGLLRRTPWWSFVDWVAEKQEIPTYDAKGESCVTTLEYLGALIDASELERALGDPALAERYKARAARVRSGLESRCWDSSRKLFADSPDHKVFSQQVNILAVLYDVAPKVDQPELVTRLLKIEPGTTPDGVLSASYYFRFYLARALDHARMGDAYLGSLDPWRKLLPLHFSTWPEMPGDTRSDSHAWSAHPIYDLLTLVAGIEPGSPGFATVRIAPHLGDLPSLNAVYPHPQGDIKVGYKLTGKGVGNRDMRGGVMLHATIDLPGKLSGSFEYNGLSWPLKPGPNHIDVPMR